MGRLISSDGAPGAKWWFVGVFGLTALYLRVCNLGSFSLWLDEVFTMRVAAQPLLETLNLCAADAENVPVYAVIANLGLKIGLVEPWIRLLPVTAGLASIGLLAIWTNRHFGRDIAMIVAAFCVLSPFHIRYSQELRAYPYLLLVCTATLVLVDRLRAHPNWATAAALSAVVALGFYTNLTYALVLVPVAAMMMAAPSSGPGGDPATGRSARRYFLAAVVFGILAFIPWLWLISSTLVSRLSRTRTTDWTLEAVGQRWEGLAVAPGHFNLLSWIGVVLAIFFVIGIAAAARLPMGRSVLLPALATLVGWEAVLAMVHHWSAPRYDTALWPFLVILTALGFDQVLRLLHWRWLRWTACAAIAAMLLSRVDAYQRFGRPHWDHLAAAVREVRRPGERVIAIDNFRRECLSYYLDKPVTSLNEKAYRLRTELEKSPSVLVVSKGRLRPKYLRQSDTFAQIASIPCTAYLYRLRRTPPVLSGEASSGEHGRPETWPNPVAERVSGSLEADSASWLVPPRFRSKPVPAGPPTRTDFDPMNRARLVSGWGRPVRRDDGTTLAWVRGFEASVHVGSSEDLPHQVEIRLASHPKVASDQWVRVLLNGHVLGEKRVGHRPRVLRFNAPARLWRERPGLLVLQFSRSYSDGGTGQGRAATVDWIEWTPHERPNRDSRQDSRVGSPTG